MKSKVYTRTGDKGETSLVSGNRLLKSDRRIDLYGDVDELNSYIGLFVSSLEKRSEFEGIHQILQKIQSALFDLGSNLACEKENRDKFKLPQLNKSLVEEMEKQIDEMDGQLPKLKNFILPGGNISSSYSHICRVITRKVERKFVGFQNDFNDMPELSIEFTNRLSDYFFVVSRYINFKSNISETEWIPNT